MIIIKTFTRVLPIVKLCVVLTILLIKISESDARTSKELNVTLPNGSRLIGRYLTSVSGKGILSFLGVPFAEPPINEMRFKVLINYFKPN